MRDLAEAVAAAVGEGVRFEGRVAGGDIAEAARAVTASGRELFVKWAPGAAGSMFVEEARGLRALAGAGGCRVPEVIAAGQGFLVLGWIAQGRRGSRWGEGLGRGLARQHRATAERYGFDADNFIGSTPQPNGWGSSWVDLFRERRLGHMHGLLRALGRCPASLGRRLDAVCERLDEWLALPGERPALLHGDLWSGNAIADATGEPVIIDPAVYYGCREADLAMTELFGGFPGSFLDAYREAWPLEPGYDERRDLYNLYHLLNHAVLFGGGYVASAEQVCRRFVG